MKTYKKYLVALMTIGILLVGYSHYDTQEKCLASKKPKTDSATPNSVSPFTGEYERLGGVLFCIDSRGILHAHKDK